MIKVLNPSTLEEVVTIDIVQQPKIKEVINRDYVFDFVTIVDDKNQFLTNDYIFEVDDNYFKVAQVYKRRSRVVDVQVHCEHVSYDLLKIERYPMPNKEMEGTGKEILEKLLENTPFQVGNVDYVLDDRYIEFSSDNIRDAIYELANLVMGEVHWDKFTVHLVEARGNTDTTREIKLGTDLVSVTETIDYTEKFPFQYIDVDVIDLSQIPLTEVDFTQIRIGDAVNIIDEELGIDLDGTNILRVVSIEYDPFNAVNPKIEVGHPQYDMVQYYKEFREEVDDIQKQLLDLWALLNLYWVEEFKIGEVDCLALDNLKIENETDEIQASIPYLELNEFTGLSIKLKQEYVGYKVTVTEYTETETINYDYETQSVELSEKKYPYEGLLAISIRVENKTDANDYQLLGVKFVENIPAPIPDEYRIEFATCPLANVMTYTFENILGYDEIKSITTGIVGEEELLEPIHLVSNPIMSGEKYKSVEIYANWNGDKPDVAVSIQAVGVIKGFDGGEQDE